MKKNTSWKQAKEAFKYTFFFLLIFWILQFLKLIIGLNLNHLGIYPRSVYGLIGLITAPFIHGNLQHLIANTLPFGIFCFLFFSIYRRKAWQRFILIWITAGFITWLIGRPAWHIGASGIIYALASFLIFGGILSRKFLLILLSVLLLIIYSGLIWGIFPSDTQTSWEGHLAGALSGLFWAYSFRKSLRK